MNGCGRGILLAGKAVKFILKNTVKSPKLYTFLHILQSWSPCQANISPISSTFAFIFWRQCKEICSWYLIGLNKGCIDSLHNLVVQSGITSKCSLVLILLLLMSLNIIKDTLDINQSFLFF